MTKTINPTRGILATLAATVDAEQPIIMLNLLKFKNRAGYDDGTDCSGRDAYATYAQHSFPKVREAGGEILYYGTVQGTVIGPADENWDEVIVVRYPSLVAFRHMIGNAEYQRIAVHRTAALEDSRLLLTQAVEH